MATRGRKKKAPKDPWPLVGAEFRSQVQGERDEGKLRDQIAECQLNRCALKDAQTKDLDYQGKKEAFKLAGAVYREGDRAQAQKIAFVRAELRGRGKDDGEFDAEDAREDLAKQNLAGSPS